jgi:hypothetical protein
MFAAAWLAATAFAQEVITDAPPMVDNGALPMTLAGEGDYFSQDLGTIFRLRYNTESYGQYGRGNFSIGTMPVWSFDDSIAFFDGQVTLNELQGVGYNLGLGYRQLTNPAISRGAGRIAGVSFWTDGTSTDEGNFFPQIGLSLESLGDMWDYRANGYLPLGPDSQMGDFNPTGVTGFQGFSIAELTQAVLNTSYAVADLEAARRLGSERDAWGFAGPYFVSNDDDNAVGYRLGVRGYAYPDLLLQFAVTDDDIFKTNATFSVTWFVGRTRSDFQPTCGVPDRMREPVMRNDYVALAQSFVTGGDPLTRPDGSALRVVHVDSDAPEGGDGSFENPFNNLTDVNGAGSLVGDIILAHAESEFTGEGSTTLKDDQRLLGEGDGFVHTVATAQQGVIEIPETFTGASDAARPEVSDTLADAIVLDPGGNEVTNFDFEDIDFNAIFGTGLTSNATLRELSVTGGTGTGITLTDVATTSTITLDEFVYDGGATSLGGISLTNFDGILNATDSSLTGGNSAGTGVEILGDSDGTMTFASTVTFDNVTGTAFLIDGDDGGVDSLGGTITVNGPIENDAGRSVIVRNVAANANIDFNANITDEGLGILIENNSGGTITFATGTIDLDIDTPGNDSIQLTNNTGATIEFIGPVDIDATNGADGLIATGGGTLRYSNTANAITTDTGRVVQIENMTIQTPNGVVISDINRTAAANTSAVQVVNNTGGTITLGNVADTSAGDSGTLQGGGADTVVINNSANVALSAVIINNQAGFSGVHIENTTAAAKTVNLNDLQINGGNRGVEVDGAGGAGALTMTFNDSVVNDSTDVGLRIEDLNGGTVNVNNLDVLNDGSAGDGVALLNNSASTNITFNNLDIDTTTGDGFTANSGGTLAVTGTTNSIDTTTGTGLELRNMAIAASGANFQRVNVNGAANGVVLQNLTGGQVTVGSTTGSTSTLTTTGDAISLENVANADFNNVDVTSSGGRGVFAEHDAANANTMDITFNDLNLISSSGLGVDVDADGAQTFNLRINNSTIAESVDMDSTGTGAFKVLLDNTDITTGGADVALSLFFDDTADGDVTIRNGSQIVAANARALDMTVAGGGTQVAALIESSTFTSATAEDLFLFNDTGAQTDATIRNNTFSDSSVVNDVVIESSGSNAVGTRIDLNLVGNGLAASTIFLDTDNAAAAPFNFGVVDRDNVDDNNAANVDLNPAPANFEDIEASDVELPNGP